MAARRRLCHLFHRSQDARRHGRHRDHDGDPPLHPDASIIIITAYATVDTAITAMKEGAQEYIVKPCNPEEISLLVNRIIKVKNLQRENQLLRKTAHAAVPFRGHHQQEPQDAGRSSTWCATSPACGARCWCSGESGTGKELVARAIHNSRRARRPSLRRRFLRGAGRNAARIRTVRLRKGLVHRGRRPGEGQVRAGGRGHHLSGRNRRHLPQAAGGSAARPAGAQLLSGGRQGGGARGRPRHRRHPPRTCKRRSRRAASAKTCSTA